MLLEIKKTLKEDNGIVIFVKPIIQIFRETPPFALPLWYPNTILKKILVGRVKQVIKTTRYLNIFVTPQAAWTANYIVDLPPDQIDNVHQYIFANEDCLTNCMSRFNIGDYIAHPHLGKG